MVIKMLNPAYLVLDNNKIIELKNPEYFSTVIKRLGECKSWKEFNIEMAKDKERIPYTIYDVEETFDYNQDLSE